MPAELSANTDVATSPAAEPEQASARSLITATMWSTKWTSSLYSIRWVDATHGCCVRVHSLVTCDVQHRVSMVVWGQWYAMILPKKRAFPFYPSKNSQGVCVKQQHGSGTAITAE